MCRREVGALTSRTSSCNSNSCTVYLIHDPVGQKFLIEGASYIAEDIEYVFQHIMASSGGHKPIIGRDKCNPGGFQAFYVVVSEFDTSKLIHNATC